MNVQQVMDERAFTISKLCCPGSLLITGSNSWGDSVVVYVSKSQCDQLADRSSYKSWTASNRFLPLGVGVVRPNAPFTNIRTTLEGALAKRKERENEAGWVNKKLKTGRPALTSS